VRRPSSKRAALSLWRALTSVAIAVVVSFFGDLGAMGWVVVDVDIVCC